MTEKVKGDTPPAADRTSGDIRSTTPSKGDTWTHEEKGGNVLYAGGRVAFRRTPDLPMYRGKNP